MADTFWTKPPIPIAHRGGAGKLNPNRHRRENTLGVFKAAVKLGYDYLELDVTNTADSQVIVLHVTADRVEAKFHKRSAPDAQKLQQYTYSELKKRLGREIPTLEEVLKALPKTKFLIDAKTDEVVKPLAEVIKKTKSKNRVYLNSFFIHRVIKLQALLGEDLNCGVIISRHPRIYNWHTRALYRGDYFGKGFSAITISRRFLTKRNAALIHQHNLKVMVWRASSPRQINRVIKMGADGIITDDPETLLRVLKEK